MFMAFDRRQLVKFDRYVSHGSATALRRQGNYVVESVADCSSLGVVLVYLFPIF